jgi:large subunit ribosomal protein L10
MESLRRGLPDTSSVAVAKNSLMRVAVRETPGWSELEAKGCEGDNAWIFVGEDGIADTVKFWNKFSGDLEKAAQASAPKGSTKAIAAPTSVTCAVMDGKYMTPAELKRCESLPTKLQLITTVARMLKQPARKVAVGVSMVPRKIAYGVKALADLDEDKSKLVGDVAKPKAA